MQVTLTEAAAKYAFNEVNAASVLGAAGTPVLTGTDAPGGDVSITIPFSKGFSMVENFHELTDTSANFLSEQFLSPTGEVLVDVQGPVYVDTNTIEALLANPFALANGNDTITGNSANNVLIGFGGNDHIDGGAGTDTAVFRGVSSQYAITKNGAAVMTVSGPDGTDTLVNVERLQFSDRTIAFDTSGTGGEAYRLYQAAFDRAPDMGGLGYWINALDHGAALNDVANAFVGSAEFAATYGPLNSLGYVQQLYENVLHRAGEQAGVDYWTGHLLAGDLTRAQVLAMFSESPENQANVIGVIQNGMAFTPYAG